MSVTKITTGDGRLHLAFPGHVNIAQPGSLTDELAVWLGETFDIYTAGANTFQSKDTLVQAGGCETARYTKTNQAADGSRAESMYSQKLDAAGAVVRRHDAVWNVYAMEPASPDWRNYHAATIATALKGHPGDKAVFSDSAGGFSYSQGIKPSAGEKGPLMPGTRDVYPHSDWFDRVRDNLDTWMAQHPETRFLVNGLESATMTVYAPTVGMIENAFKSNSGVLPSLILWEKTMQLIRQAQSVGWTPWVYAKLPSWDVRYLDPWRSLMVPSMFLADEGSLLYGIGGREGTANAWEVPEYRHKWYGVGLGAPQEVMQRQGTLAYRHYQGALVAVNPDGVDQTFHPPEGGMVKLAAHSGGFYERSVSWQPI